MINWFIDQLLCLCAFLTSHFGYLAGSISLFPILSLARPISISNSPLSRGLIFLCLLYNSRVVNDMFLLVFCLCSSILKLGSYTYAAKAAAAEPAIVCLEKNMWLWQRLVFMRGSSQKKKKEKRIIKARARLNTKWPIISFEDDNEKRKRALFMTGIYDSVHHIQQIDFGREKKQSTTLKIFTY